MKFSFYKQLDSMDFKKFEVSNSTKLISGRIPTNKAKYGNDCIADAVMYNADSGSVLGCRCSGGISFSIDCC